jgi:hypothetical protein
MEQDFRGHISPAVIPSIYTLTVYFIMLFSTPEMIAIAQR